MRYIFFIFACAALPGFAQEGDVQRQLIQRQQQTDTFQLQLRQSQDRLHISPGDIRHQQEFDARQTSERQLLDSVSAKQLRDVKPDTPPELRPYERQKADAERRPLTGN